MPRLAANLTLLFTEVPFLDRFEQAALAGFEGVEYLFPYAWEKTELASRLKQHNLKQVLHNLPAGDFDAGERGIAILPDRVEEFRESVQLTIEYASELQCPQVNCLAGLRPEGVSEPLLRETFVNNLKYAADAFAQHNIRLLIEAINTGDIPGFYLTHSAQAMSIIEEVAHPNLQFQYDIYHMQIMEGDLASTMERLLPWIPHMQLADVPGRHEPGSGEINYEFLFRHLDRIGYSGWIGCEYHPATKTVDGLGWMKTLMPTEPTSAS